jgi:hypothetical protein
MPSKAELDARHARKLAARQDGSVETRSYPAGRGAGGIYEIDDATLRHQAKLEARVAAFLEPKAEKVAPKPKADLSEAELEAATRPEPKAEKRSR